MADTRRLGYTHYETIVVEFHEDRLAPCPHGGGIGVESPLDLLDEMLVLPAGDPALLGRRACHLIGQVAQAAVGQ